MRNFPDQPTTGAIVPPMVYVTEKTIWEYKQIVRSLAKDNIPTEEELNRLGKDGWDHRLGGLAFAVGGAVLCLAVAAASFYVVERPALRIGRRLAGRRGYLEGEGGRPGAPDRPGAPTVELAGADRHSRT